MWNYYLSLLLAVLIAGCLGKNEIADFTDVEIEELYTDSLSIRAIELTEDRLLFAANKGVYGTINLANNEVVRHELRYEEYLPEFRAVGKTRSHLFMLSVANPTLLYQIDGSGDTKLVYEEKDSLVFYDAMRFWNDQEGIAMGDYMHGCLSIIITRDGGKTWHKVDCSELPDPIVGEGAYAASNTNIAIVNDHTWIATSSSRIYYSSDKGETWQVTQTPVINGESAQGIYSIDFYNEEIGIAIGGDYTAPEKMKANKAITTDGGISWELIADGMEPSYKSCVQFIPNTGGRGLVAVGFTGISYSGDRGLTWKKISEEALYTIRFLNDKVAYGAGSGRIVKLHFH